MRLIFSFNVLTVIACIIIRSSTLHTFNRTSYLDTEKLLESDLANATRKPIILTIKRAIAEDDDDGFSKFLSQLTETKDSETLDDQVVGDENINSQNLLRIPQTEYPIFYTQRSKKISKSQQKPGSVFYPFNKVNFDTIDPNSIAIELYDPLVNWEKLNDLDFTDPSKKMRINLDNKYLDLIRKSGYLHRHSLPMAYGNKIGQQKSHQKSFMDIFSTTTTKSSIIPNAVRTDNTSDVPPDLAVDPDAHRLRNALFQITGLSTENTKRLMQQLDNKISSNDLSTSTESLNVNTEATKSGATTMGERKLYEKKSGPLSLQILLTLKINNNGTIELSKA